MRVSVESSTPIPGWQCEESGKAYRCSPSDEYIALAAYYISEKHPEQSPEQNWAAGEDELLVNWEDGK